MLLNCPSAFVHARAQVKKQEVRQMMIDVDKLDSPVVTFDEFVEMVTPRMSGRDTREEIMKVRDAPRVGCSRGQRYICT